MIVIHTNYDRSDSSIQYRRSHLHVVREPWRLHSSYIATVVTMARVWYRMGDMTRRQNERVGQVTIKTGMLLLFRFCHFYGDNLVWGGQSRLSSHFHIAADLPLWNCVMKKRPGSSKEFPAALFDTPVVVSPLLIELRTRY